MSSVWMIILYVAGGYGMLVLCLFFFQSKLLYFPSRDIVATPARAGLPYEPVTFTTGDQVRLDGWFVPAEEPRAVLLFFHGNAGNISHRLDSLSIFHELGLSVLIFDYRGFGRSDGRMSEEGSDRDAEAALRYLKEERGVPLRKIVYFGRSLGGAVAAHLATKETPAALIIESTFTSVPDLAAQLYPFLPVRLLNRFAYDAKKALEAVSCPVLIVHSADDEIIPIKHGRELLAVANDPKQFLEIHGSHNEGFLFSKRDYMIGLDRFLTSVFEHR
jgi:uncharacterized protein